MNIRDIRELKKTASKQLSDAPQAKKIALIYGIITVALSALVTVINYFAGTGMSNFGGLRNIGIRSFLSTIQTVAPMIQSLLLLALELGYLNATLRISRGQYASPNALKMGFDRFWPVLRLSLIQGLLYLMILMLSVYLSIQIFLITPFSNDFMALASGFVNTADPLSMVDEATYLALAKGIVPLFPIWGIVFFLMFVPIFYQLRMANYILIDNPKMPTLLILRQSRLLMKRNGFNLFRLDVSLWWYFLLSVLASVAGYGDMLLPMVGITFPWSDTVGYFLFYGIYLVLQLGIVYFFMNHVSVTYALAYQSLCPEKKEDTGVVLGNIFQM